MSPEQFAVVYRTLDLGSRHIAALVRRDGIVLSRVPDAAPATHFRPRGIGTYHVDDAEGGARIGAQASVPRTEGQLSVDVSVARDEALGDFRRGLVSDGAVAGFALVVLFVGTRLLVVGLRRRERLQVELARANRVANAARAEAENAQHAAEAANRAKSEFLAR